MNETKRIKLARELFMAMNNCWYLKDGGIRLTAKYLKLADYVMKNFKRKKEV